MRAAAPCTLDSTSSAVSPPHPMRERQGCVLRPLPQVSRRMAASFDVPDHMRRKYGRYLPWQRLNVDQVPLPFVNDMEVTYEEVSLDPPHCTVACVVIKPCRHSMRVCASSALLSCRLAPNRSDPRG